jgi:hypothetical protein
MRFSMMDPNMYKLMALMVTVEAIHSLVKASIRFFY